MLLWVMFAGLTAAVLIVVLRPAFAAMPLPRAAEASDLAVYAEQYADLERQFAKGQIDPAEYDALRTEVSRRILRSQPERPQMASLTSAPSRLPVLAAAVLSVACIGLYGLLGAPGVPARPFSDNAGQIADARAEDLIAKVEVRLAEHPEDGRGWDVLAPIYFRLQRYADAADAYERAGRLLGETPARLAGFAEATVLASDGIVTDTARAAYEKLRAAEPARFEARFWLAMAKEQDGKRDDAASDYRAMLAAAPADAPWRGMVEQRLSEVSKTTEARGPTEAAVGAAASMSADERAAMIDGMVEQLAVRLKSNGDDVEGWQRLITSYATLKKPAKARSALGDARRALAGNPAAVAILEKLAARLELSP